MGPTSIRPSYSQINGEGDACMVLPNLTYGERSVPDDSFQAALENHHAELYIQSGLYVKEKAIKRAKLAVTSILTTFPCVSDKNVLLAAIDWLGLLLVVDDKVERLSHGDGKLALEESIKILQAAMDDTPPVELELGAKSDSGYGAPSSTTQQILALSRTFVDRVRDLLPCSVFVAFLGKIVEVWEMMIMEILARQAGHITETEYLEIRHHTIGLGPFYMLLLHHFNCWKLQASLHDIMSSVSLAVGMQNDLIGLKKDLANGERFNIVLMLTDPSRETLEARRWKAIAFHNNAVQSAIGDWMQFRATHNSDVQAFASCLLELIDRHFLWVHTSVRYATTTTTTGGDLEPKRLKASMKLLSMRWVKARRKLHRQVCIGPRPIKG